MSSITVRLPDSSYSKIWEVAQKDGISIKQFLSRAAEEKLSAFLTVDYLRNKANESNDGDFSQLLGRLPDHEPPEWDSLD